jgi:hypothetical protein
MLHREAIAPRFERIRRVPVTLIRREKSVHRSNLLILAAVAVGAAGVAAFALHREGAANATAVSSSAAPHATEHAAQPPRPALSAAEEQYMRDLWPIHGDVQRSTVRMSLGQIFYLTKDMTKAELGTRVKEALATYQAAEAKIRALEPPAPLRSDHEEYLAAVRLLQASAAEVQKMFTDGREDHMKTAYPMGQEGTDKLRAVGGKFWPQEFPPH